MANILLLTLVFSPDGVSTSVLLTELAQELKALGHNITVLTTTPHYNIDPDTRAQQPLKPRWPALLYQSDCNGIPVYHASIPTKGDRVRARLLDYTRFHAISTIAGLVVTRNYDVIIAPSPPLTIGMSAWLLGRIRCAPFIYNVQEIYPDVAVSLGMLSNPILIRLMESMETLIYNRARVVVVISDWFRRRLLSKGVPDRKLRVISNFVDTNFIKPGERLNYFSKRHELEDKFTVLYAGNIGLTQNFENILSAARRLNHLRDLLFLIVGDGARRSWLEEKLACDEYPNVKILAYQSRSEVPLLYASSDVCLVPLKGGTAQETFPSKIYTIMAAGRPVIAAADEDSELSWVTRESKCGWAVAPDDDVALARAIEQAYHQRGRLLEKGKFGRKYVVEQHSRGVIAHKYDELIKEVVNYRQEGGY